MQYPFCNIFLKRLICCAILFAFFTQGRQYVNRTLTILLYKLFLVLVFLSVSPAHSNGGLPPGELSNDRLLWESSSGSWIASRPVTQTVSQISARPSIGINYIIATDGRFPARNSADPTIGQIEMFAGNFAPRGYAFCNGQLLSISSYTFLFSVIGTTYGGDGRTTFALPDLRGRLAVHSGTGPGLTTVNFAIPSGASSHTHAVQ